MSGYEPSDPSPADVQEHLGGVDYPATKAELLEQARRQDAPKKVIHLLDRLPDRRYESPVEVTKEVGKLI